jgi:hypothetical protein
MRGLVEIHSDIFGQNNHEKNIRPIVPSSNRPSEYDAIQHKDAPPPLAQAVKGIIPHDAPPPLSQIMNVGSGTLEGMRRDTHQKVKFRKPTELQLSTFMHHCEFGFMRSQLSRLYIDDGVDLRGGVFLGDPTLRDIIETGQKYSEEELDQFLNILRLRIRNNYALSEGIYTLIGMINH